jgi:hypothetical protein
MIRSELYDRTMAIIMEAYFNDTLQHSACTACVVGNIVAANMGYKVVPTGDKIFRNDGDYPYDQDKQYTFTYRYFNWITTKGAVIEAMETNWNIYSPIYEARVFVLSDRWRDGLTEIKSTGYSVSELSRIEYAFEAAPKGTCDEDWMFNGLCAVIEVLDEIHENDSIEQSEVIKQTFNRRAAHDHQR